MKREVKTFAWTCDHCRTIEYVTGTSEYTRPDGWGQRASHGHAMIPSPRWEDVCPTCRTHAAAPDSLNEVVR